LSRGLTLAPPFGITPVWSNTDGGDGVRGTPDSGLPPNPRSVGEETSPALRAPAGITPVWSNTGGGDGLRSEGEDKSPAPRSEPSAHVWSKLRRSAGVSEEQITQRREKSIKKSINLSPPELYTGKEKWSTLRKSAGVSEK